MCLRRGLLVPILVCLFATSVTFAGEASADNAESKPKVSFSWDGRFFIDDLPHGKAFLIEIAIPKGLTFKQGLLWRSETKCDKVGEQTRILPFASTGKEGDKEGARTITLSAPALKYSTAYCFRFTATEGLDADQVAAIGNAVQAMVKVISERALYTSAQRAEFLKNKLGELAQQTLVVDGASTEVLDWVGRWTESDERFVALWQQHGDRERAAEKVVSYADKLRGLDFADAQLVFATSPAPLASALKGFETLRGTVETSGLTRAVTAHLTTDATPALTAIAITLRDRARTLREQAKGAYRQLCESRARPSSSMSELGIEIDRLQREVVNLETQIASASPDDRKQRAALEQKQARLRASKRALVQRRTDRLCKNLISLRTYSGRLADSLVAELQAALEIARLQTAIRKVIDDKKAVIPVEVVHGTRSADPTYTERATAYISADVGTVFPRFSSGNWGASLFVGVNFTFRPLDKDIPLSEDGGFGKRFSLIAGLTITEFRDDAQTVTGVAGGQAALFGVGYRISDYLRVGAGGVLFRQTHPNPAIDSKSLKIAPYIALSVDSDVGGLIKNLISTGKKNAL